MDPEVHLIGSVILSMVGFYFTESIPFALAIVVGGFLIDIDHFVDYWRFKGKITFGPEFFGDYNSKDGKVFVVLHSVELMPLIMLITGLLGLAQYGFAFVIGMCFHLVLDYLYNGVHPLAYFFLYRLLLGFNARSIIVETEWIHSIKPRNYQKD